jgi:hypothetical protein
MKGWNLDERRETKTETRSRRTLRTLPSVRKGLVVWIFLTTLQLFLFHSEIQPLEHLHPAALKGCSKPFKAAWLNNMPHPSP